DPPRHLHIFSPRSLRGVVERAGLSCKTVRTTARYARFAWSASTSIRSSGGRANSGRARGFARAQSLAFQLYEHLLVSWGRDAGEEIVLIGGPPCRLCSTYSPRFLSIAFDRTARPTCGLLRQAGWAKRQRTTSQRQ